MSTEVSDATDVVIVCGDNLPHVRLGSHSFWAANRLELVRCSDSVNILSLCEKLRPSLLVAGQTFIEAVPDNHLAVITGANGARILVLLNQASPEATTSLLQRGCHGVLPPKFPARLLQRAVPAILGGELWAPRRVISEMLSHLLKARTARPENGLTPREEHILELVGRGYKNSEIASSLFISQETVRWHKRRLYRKIGRARVPVTPMPSRRMPPISQSPLVEASTRKA